MEDHKKDQEIEEFRKNIKKQRTEMQDLEKDTQVMATVADFILDEKKKNMKLKPEQLEIRANLLEEKIDIFKKTGDELYKILNKLKEGEYDGLGQKNVHTEIGILLLDINTVMSKLQEMNEQMFDLAESACDYESKSKLKKRKRKRNSSKDNIKADFSKKTRVAVKLEEST